MDERTVSPKVIAVAGGGLARARVAELAIEVGAAIASAGYDLVCGGLGGVMEAACRGAKSKGGRTIGILPTANRLDANSFVDVAIATGLGEGNNMMIARTCDAVIALDARYMTLCEIAYALQLEKPVVGINTWSIVHPGVSVEDPILIADDAKAAVEMVTAALNKTLPPIVL